MRNVPDSAPLGLPSMTSTAQHTAPRAGTPVVLIDDNEELADNLREILEARGYACEIAHTGKRGQRLAERIHPDVCVIDLNLPDVHGLEILAQLREQLPETECVVLTGYGALETAIEAVNRGAFAYGVKSFRFDDVLTSIDRAATAVQQRREHASLAGELDRERSLLDATFEGGPLAMLALAGNGGGEVLRANARAKGLFGLGSHPTARVERTALLNLARNETERRRLEQALQCPPGSRRTADIDVNRPHAGPGTVRVFVQHTSPTTSRDDQVTVVMLEDITEARELARIAESSSRLAAVGELAARVAHEIRNPLQGIAGAVRVLSRGWEADPNRRELAGEVSAQIKRLNDFVEDLLVMARPLRVDPRRLEGRKAIEGALTVLREHPVVSPLEITVTAEDSTDLWVDPRLLNIVVENLVLNAAQAVGAEGSIQIQLDPAPGGTLLRFQDDGPGLAEEVIPLLFEPFATTRIEGTGLGLSTTQRIVEGHGGTITPHNGAKGGACFDLYFPSPPA